MKNFKKFTAFVLALCMLFSLSISAFAAEKTPTGYLTWTLDDSGTLTISGNGRIAAFTSAEDQPWHEMRENITSVKFDPGAHMVVPDVAYWFADCINLKSCVLPSFANLGADAFKDCANLNRLQLHYNDDSFYISDTAFSGVDMSALEIVTCDEVTMGILDAKGITFVAAYPVLMISSGACGVSGCNCSSCSFTYDYEQKDESKHYVWECCTNCSANEYAYVRFRERYEAEIAAQETKIEQMNQSLLQLKEARQQDDAFVSFFQKYGNIERLDRDTVNQLIQKVVFHDKQNIEVYFRFADEYEKLCSFANTIQEQTTSQFAAAT